MINRIRDIRAYGLRLEIFETPDPTPWTGETGARRMLAETYLAYRLSADDRASVADRRGVDVGPVELARGRRFRPSPLHAIDSDTIASHLCGALSDPPTCDETGARDHDAPDPIGDTNRELLALLALDLETGEYRALADPADLETDCDCDCFPGECACFGPETPDPRPARRSHSLADFERPRADLI